MACSTCASKNQGQTNLVQFQRKNRKGKKRTARALAPCKYTFEQISGKLETTDNPRHKNYLKNALKNYSKNCNLFNRQLDKVFI